MAYSECPPVILYTDASESPDYRGLGIVTHDMDNPSRGRFYAADICPPWFFKLFSAHGKSTICSLELLAALCALLTMRDHLRNRRVCLYVDNTAARS